MHPHTPDPRNAWRSLATRYSTDASLVDSLYRELVAHYCEPHRHYHTLDHITALLRLFVQFEADLKKPDIVLFSIFYHDVVYTPGRGDNEEQSAKLAFRALEQLGVPVNVIEAVRHYVLVTRHHQLTADADTDLKLFIDFDLSILAADLETYRTYLDGVRKEYAYLSVEQFAQGRSAFLQNMLSQEHIFYSNRFESKEEATRKNMQWELQMSPDIYSAR